LRERLRFALFSFKGLEVFENIFNVFAIIEYFLG
jgi:hypothetical protein